MNPKRLPRHLAAILYADVVGFSRMSEVDEETTFLNVRDYLDHFAKNIESYHGDVIKYAGDAVLAIFNSASDALVCAARVQIDLDKRNELLSDDRKICFRIGLNLGDVIKDRGDIFGDGVNVAARLEALSKPGGICVGGSLYDAVVMKLPFDFEYMGEQSVKNITKPIRAYHATPQQGADLPLPYKEKIIPKTNKTHTIIFPLISAFSFILVSFLLWFMWAGHEEQTLSDDVVISKPEKLDNKNKKTIIILPFNNMSTDAEQTYFSDGMTEDLITDLSQLSNLRVLARNTSFKYKGKIIDPVKIGKELKVTHLLEGSVRKSGDLLRINAQLIDTKNGHHLWAERYDRKLIDVFSVQDDVTRNIVTALSLHLTVKDKSKLSLVTTTNTEAYELFLQGQKLMFEETKESNMQAQEVFLQAIKLDPEYARAYGTLAVAITFAINYGWMELSAKNRERAYLLALKATELNSQSQHVHWSLGFVQLYRKEYSKAAEAVKKSIKLAPSFADGYTLLALIENFLGRPNKSINLMKKAILLNPLYSWEYPYNLGHSYYMLGEYKRSIKYLQESLSRNPNARPARMFLIVSYIGLGMQDEAEWEVKEVLALYPDVTLSTLSRESIISENNEMKLFIGHLRKAGFPE